MCGDSALRLLTHRDVPVWATEKYVLTGYRYRWTFWQCTRSIFAIHSETFNIWSHLLELVLTVAVLVATECAPVRDARFEWVMRVFLLGNVAKCLGSAAAHTYCCMSYRVKNLMWQLDYLGIFVYVITSAVTQTLYGRRRDFLADDASVSLYLTAAAGVSVITFALSAVSRYFPARWRPEVLRLVCYTAAFVGTNAPMLHRLYHHYALGIDLDVGVGGTAHTVAPAVVVDAGCGWWAAWTLLCISAGVSLGSFLPERLKPGIGDLLWRSHHGSHLLSGVAVYAEYRAMLVDVSVVRPLMPDADVARYVAMATSKLSVALAAIFALQLVFTWCTMMLVTEPAPAITAAPVDVVGQKSPADIVSRGGTTAADDVANERKRDRPTTMLLEGFSRRTSPRRRLAKRVEDGYFIEQK